MDELQLGFVECIPKQILLHVAVCSASRYVLLLKLIEKAARCTE